MSLGVTDQTGRGIGCHGKRARTDGKVRIGHAHQIHHQRHGKDRATSTDEAKGESDQAARQGAKQILDRFEGHAALPISCGAAIHSRPFSMPCQ